MCVGKGAGPQGSVEGALPPPHSLQHFIVSSTMTLIRPSQTAVKSGTPDGVFVSSNPCVLTLVFEGLHSGDHFFVCLTMAAPGMDAVGTVPGAGRGANPSPASPTRYLDLPSECPAPGTRPHLACVRVNPRIVFVCGELYRSLWWRHKPVSI